MTRLAQTRLAPVEARKGPRLSDGAQLRDLFDFNKREIAMRVLTDPEIYRLELKRIFARSWIALGHVVEIPNAGDYIKRHIGEDEVIVARGRDGKVSVFLNACSHRGMQICWADSGNQASFKCPYHGWVFDHAGNLIGAPFEKEMYGAWDKSRYGLRKARSEIYLGRIFATFDDNAEPLDEWLDEAGYYLARPYAGNEGVEMELLEAPRRFTVHANWKIASENNSGDGYHGISLHASLPDIIGMPPANIASTDTVKVSSIGHGHGLFGFKLNSFGGPSLKGDPYDIDNMFFNTVLFPSSFGIGGQANRRAATDDGDGYVIAHLGGVVPRGHGAFELWTATAIQTSAPEAAKQMMLKGSAMLDLAGADDMEAWPSMLRVANGAIGAEQLLRYHTLAGENKPANWPGPGAVYSGVSKDDNQWNWWRRWYDMMSIDEG